MDTTRCLGVVGYLPSKVQTCVCTRGDGAPPVIHHNNGPQAMDTDMVAAEEGSNGQGVDIRGLMRTQSWVSSARMRDGLGWDTHGDIGRGQ